MNNLIIFDSIDINQLKSVKVEDLRKELRFRHLPDKGNKEDLVNLLLVDNERVIVENLQESMIASRHKQKEDLMMYKEMQQKLEKYESKDNSQISIELLTQLVHTQKLISENLSSKNNINQVQILSTNDTANAISLFSGKNQRILQTGFWKLNEFLATHTGRHL